MTAFAAGLLDGGVAPTLKHFPGLGLATASTDDAAVRIAAPEEGLAPGLAPYRRAIAAGVAPVVMVSNAAYAAYGTHGVTLGQAAVRAARAGVDLLLCVGSESSTDAVYNQLLAAARGGRLPRASLEQSAARIDELAATYAG